LIFSKITPTFALPLKKYYKRQKKTAQGLDRRQFIATLKNWSTAGLSLKTPYRTRSLPILGIWINAAVRHIIISYAQAAAT
jgi:hypothetical protein